MISNRRRMTLCLAHEPLPSPRLLTAGLIGFVVLGCLMCPAGSFAGVQQQRAGETTERSTSEPARRTFQEGRELVAGGQWAKAAEKFDEVIAKYPQCEDADASL